MSIDGQSVSDHSLLFLACMCNTNCTVGYGTLGDFVHIYHYASLEERATKRKLMGQDARWTAFLEKSRPCLKSQRSEIFVPLALDTSVDTPAYFDLHDVGSGTAVYEIRHYQLVPGYESIPKMQAIFNRGLPDKLRACGTSTGQLILLAASSYSVLNQLIEIWRYPSVTASLQHREASRKAKIWNETIADAAKLTQTFQNRIMLPTSFSPLK
jgi:NIPSNAP